MTTRGVPTAVSVCLLVLSCSLRPTHAGTWKADNGNGTFSNPLFYDEFSIAISSGSGMDTSGMKPGDAAGLALFNRPCAWIGVTVDEDGASLTYVTEEAGRSACVPMSTKRVWLRAACDFLTEEAQFSYSTDGTTFQPIGSPFRMVFQLMTFQGVRYALFGFNERGAGGFADFDSIDVHEPNPRGLTRPIPYGRAVELTTAGNVTNQSIIASGEALQTSDAPGTRFTVLDRGLGRVALRSAGGVVTAAPDGRLSLQHAPAGPASTFQWIETFTGELILLSLSTHRYVRLDPQSGVLRADSPGPQPNGRDGVRWQWR